MTHINLNTDTHNNYTLTPVSNTGLTKEETLQLLWLMFGTNIHKNVRNGNELQRLQVDLTTYNYYGNGVAPEEQLHNAFTHTQQLLNSYTCELLADWEETQLVLETDTLYENIN